MSGPFAVGGGHENGGTFRLEQYLGSGGFAHTYCATVLDARRAAEWGHEVCIKIPLNKKKERVLIEEIILVHHVHELLRGLESRNITPYLGFDLYDDMYVMVMEYVRDGSLRDMLDRQGALDLDTALDIAQGALEGLVQIHSAYVLHRDIKPANILMNGSTPKIADLGIGRMLHADELASSTTGTIYYMSPEILGEEGASFPTDLWSMGVTIYEMLTGHLPFGDMHTPIGTMTDLIRRGSPTPVHEVRPEVPKAVSNFVGKALARDPNERFSGSAKEMLRALRKLRRGDSDALDRAMVPVRKLMMEDDKVRAVEVELLKIVRDLPDDPRAYQYLGEFYNKCMRYDDAEAIFKRGLDCDPHSAILYWDLALVYQSRKRRKEAIDALDKATELGLEESLQRYAETVRAALERNIRG